MSLSKLIMRWAHPNKSNKTVSFFSYELIAIIQDMRIQKILETCIYAEDLEAAAGFYGEMLELEQISREENRHIFYKCGDGMLLIFNPSHTSTEQTFVNGSPVPLHGAKGPGHLALAVKEHDIPKWKERLISYDIEIESEVNWPNGCKSIYFRDPSGNSVELVSPGLWGMS